MDQEGYYHQFTYLGQLPSIELKISDIQLTNLMNLLLTLPFGSKTGEEEAEEEIDGLKLKPSPRNVATIETSKLVTAAIDFVKDRVTNVEEEEKEDKNASTQVTDSETQIIAYKDIILDFKLKEILVLLFQGSDRDPSSAIASAQLKNFETHGEVLTDSSICVTCLIADLCLNDVRTSRGSGGIKTLFEKK